MARAVPQFIQKPKIVSITYEIQISREGLTHLLQRLDNSDYHINYKRRYKLDHFLQDRLGHEKIFHFTLCNYTLTVQAQVSDPADYNYRVALTRMKKRLNELCSPLKPREKALSMVKD